MPAEATWRRGDVGGSTPAAAARCDDCAREHARGSAAGDLDMRPLLTSPENAVEILEPWLGGRDRERCVLALLDTKHRLIDVTIVSVGTLDHTFMNPREILRDALLGNAAAIIVGHNHPSGDASPSADDRVVTRRLASAARTVGIDLLDHVVIGGGQWVSMARLGEI